MDHYRDKNMTPEQIADLIRASLAAKGLTQNDLAEMLDKHPQYINDVINAREIPSKTFYDQVAKKLEIVFYLKFPIERGRGK